MREGILGEARAHLAEPDDTKAAKRIGHAAISGKDIAPSGNASYRHLVAGGRLTFP
jgi:hypothetical protein